MTDNFRESVRDEDVSSAEQETVVTDPATRVSEVEVTSRGALELITDVILHPRDAFRYLARNKHVGLAFIVAIAGTITLIASEGTPTVPNDFIEAGPVLLVVSSAFGALIGLPLSAGIVHIVARLLGGKNRYVFTLQAAGFTILPHLLAAPFYALHRVVDIFFVIQAVRLITNIWTTVLYVVAVREVYNFTTGRAIVTLAIPFVIGLVLVFTMTFFALSALLTNF